MKFKIIGLLLLQFILVQSVWAAKSSPTTLNCSDTDAGTAVINEIKTNNKGSHGFVEIYLLDEADISGWGLYVQDNLEYTLGTGSCTIDIHDPTMADNTSTGANNTTWPAGTFIVCGPVPVVPADDEILLVDTSANLSANDDSVIDYLGYGNGSNFKPKWSVDSACGTVISDHDSNNSDIARIPDGTGDLVDNGDNTSRGESNDGGGGGVDEASDFNCMEPILVGTIPTVKRVYTKLAGIDFTLDIVAIKNDGTIDTNYNQDVTIEIVDQTNNAVISTQALTFVNNTDNGKKSVTFNIANAYSNLVCRVTRAQGASSIIVISDNFAVRPLDFVINSTLDNTTTHVAGSTFDITATTTTNNYTGLPVIDNTQITAHINAVQIGTLAGVFPNATAGVSTGTSFTYSEVGNFTIGIGAVVDSGYTVIDQFTGCVQDSASNTVDVNGMYGCNIVNSTASDAIGRFIPAYFKVTSSTDGTFSNECVAGSFTYTGQEFTYDIHPSLTLTAYNSANGVTQNYTGDYNNLVDTDFDITDPITDKNQLGADGANKVNLSWDYPNSTPTLSDNGDGSLSFILEDDRYIYTHEDNNEIAPFTPEIELDFTDITDSDGVVTKQGSPLIQLSVLEPYTLTPTSSQLRFGRLVINNAYGSELAPLPVPMYTEYYNGSDFVLNTSDSCTVIATNQLLYNSLATNPITVGGGTSTASIANAPLSAGLSGLKFSAPGDGNSGAIIISGTSFITSFPWLGFDWDGDGSRMYPEATATFGLFNGGQKQIFFREVY